MPAVVAGAQPTPIYGMRVVRVFASARRLRVVTLAPVCNFSPPDATLQAAQGQGLRVSCWGTHLQVVRFRVWGTHPEVMMLEELALVGGPPVAHLEIANEQLEEGGLARAVGSDQRHPRGHAQLLRHPLHQPRPEGHYQRSRFTPSAEGLARKLDGCAHDAATPLVAGTPLAASSLVVATPLLAACAVTLHTPRASGGPATCNRRFCDNPSHARSPRCWLRLGLPARDMLSFWNAPCKARERECER